MEEKVFSKGDLVYLQIPETEEEKNSFCGEWSDWPMRTLNRKIAVVLNVINDRPVRYRVCPIQHGMAKNVFLAGDIKYSWLWDPRYMTSATRNRLASVSAEEYENVLLEGWQ